MISLGSAFQRLRFHSRHTPVGILRAVPIGGDDGCDGFGQQIDFARSKAERITNADPRLSLEERYPSHADYVNRVAAVATGLARDRLLLDEDVQSYVSKAQNTSVGN